jgi:hypothetical protein
MAMPSDLELQDVPSSRRVLAKGAGRDARALKILAKTIYKELRTGGLDEQSVMSVAGELLHLVAVDVRDRRNGV